MEPLAIIITLASGILIGWWGHTLTSKRDRATREHTDRREKETRRSEFLSTLKHWENTFVVVTEPAAIKRLYYGEAMKAIAAAAEKFRGDVADKETFDRLNFQASQMNPETLDASGLEQRRETVCGAIRRLHEFVRNA